MIKQRPSPRTGGFTSIIAIGLLLGWPNAKAQSFDSLSIQVSASVAEETFLLGPIPISLVFSNASAEVVYVILPGHPPARVLLSSHPGWDARAPIEQYRARGMAPYIPIGPGETRTSTIYLHDLASGITEGEHAVEVEVNTLVRNGGDDEQVQFIFQIELHIQEDSHQALEYRLREIFSHIHRDASYEDKRRAYNSVASLDSPVAIPYLVRALGEDPLRFGIYRFKRKLLEISHLSGEWDAVVNYLEKRGTEYDKDIFRFWQRHEVKLTEQQIERLRSSKRATIQELTAELYPGN